MIYIKKSKDGQFFVSTTSDNHEKLANTETVKTKQSAWKDIFAQAKNFNGDGFQVKDMTVVRFGKSVPVIYTITVDGDGNYTKWKTVNKLTSEA